MTLFLVVFRENPPEKKYITQTAFICMHPGFDAGIFPWNVLNSETADPFLFAQNGKPAKARHSKSTKTESAWLSQKIWEESRKMDKGRP